MITKRRILSIVRWTTRPVTNGMNDSGARLSAAWWHVVAIAILLLHPSGLFGSQQDLPNRPGSAKFAVIGDNGTGGRSQYEVAAQMATAQMTFPYDTVIMLGDNMYGSQQPKDFIDKFERPYKALLDAGVHFYAALGNHDNQNNIFYKPFNMGGKRYYTYVKSNVRFFALDTDLLDPPQLAWLEAALKESTDEWKICYFHHPLYSDARTHGSQVDVRVVLEPLFVKYGVNAVFSGHDHVYERIKPQKGIAYFVSGAGGQLRRSDIKPSALTDVFFDTDQSFMLAEVAGSELFFKAISRTGKTVDSGSIKR
jgi:predicted MPP superfamily phosphohydrolase